MLFKLNYGIINTTCFRTIIDHKTLIFQNRYLEASRVPWRGCGAHAPAMTARLSQVAGDGAEELKYHLSLRHEM